jgi:hypothetical protein
MVSSRFNASRRQAFVTPGNLLLPVVFERTTASRSPKFAPDLYGAFPVKRLLLGFARRPEQIDRMIVSCFVLGLSVRKCLPP